MEFGGLIVLAGEHVDRLETIKEQLAHVWSIVGRRETASDSIKSDLI